MKKHSSCFCFVFKYYYATSRNVNCLVNEARHFNETEFKINLKTLPGQVISLDDQCRNLFGIHSYYCAGMINDAKMCLELICYDPFQKLCWRGHEQRAATGTTCGNKKWCEKGKCVYSEKAPSAKDHCLTGDFQGRLYNGLTCLDVGYNQQRLCYEEYYNKSCCATCDAVFNKLYPKCPYGDKYDWCSFPENRRSDNCYDDRFKESCCEYCRDVATGVGDCQYGDKASWCAEDVPRTPALCYSSESLCCDTCPKYASGNTDCRYGDKASWCTEYNHASDCYNGNIAELCCDFCDRAMRQYGLTDCPYGDRKRNCRRDMCADSANWYWCCYTCQQEAGNSRILTTTSAMPTATTTATTTTTTTISSTTTAASPATTLTFNDCVDSASWCNGIDASSCYTVLDICCKTCKRFYTGKKECEYGDHFSWCTGKRDHCADPSYSDCCLTCEGFKHATTSTTVTTTRTSASTVTMTTPQINTRKNESCVDKASWCIYSNSYCYNNKHTCCHTCSRAYTGIIGCEYGDHYTWCVEPDINCQHEHVKLGCCVACNKTASSVQPNITTSTTTSYVDDYDEDCVDIWLSYCAKAKSNDCYYDSYKSGCCATCSKFNTGVADCEYGDRWSWCGTVTEDECQREDIAEPCCETCSKVNKLETSGAATAVTLTTAAASTTTIMTTTTTALFSGRRSLMFVLTVVVCYLATIT